MAARTAQERGVKVRAHLANREAILLALEALPHARKGWHAAQDQPAETD